MNPQMRMRGWSWLVLAMVGLPACWPGAVETVWYDEDEICDKIVECNSNTDRKECIYQWKNSYDIMQSEVFNSAADCILDAPCDVLLDPLDCVVSAVEEISSDVLDGFIKAVCQKFTLCNPEMGGEEGCINNARKDEDLILIFKMLKKSVRDCVQKCITNAGCDYLKDKGFEGCTRKCGIPWNF